MIHCRFCEQEHGDRLLCDAARAVLDASVSPRAADMPDSPGSLADYTLVSRFTAYPLTIPANEVNDTPRAALVFAALDFQGTLCQWLLVSDDTTIRAAAKVTQKAADTAIGRARAAR